MKMTSDVVIYIRVSSRDQVVQDYSIEFQRQYLHDYAERHGLCIVKEFVEKASALAPGRPTFREMIRFVETLSPVPGILVYAFDRLARSLKDFNAVAELKSVALISATEVLPIDASGGFVA